MSRLILLPGLGADERMFARLPCDDLPIVTPRHLVPRKGESLHAYALRTAHHHGIEADDVIGGASFGSVVAAEIARQRPVRGLVLIGGALGVDGLRMVPGSFLIRLLPAFLVRPLLRSDLAMRLVFAPEGAEMIGLVRAMMADASDELLLHGGRMLMAFREKGAIPCPLFAIHGGRDPVMAPPPVPGCLILPEAGHGIAWTHSSAVGALLRQAWEATREIRTEPPV